MRQDTMNDHDLAVLADMLPDAVVVVDDQVVVRWANQAAIRLMGRPLEEWIGSTGLDLLHPDDLGLAVVSLTSVQDKQVGTPIELRIATETGWTLVELVGAPLGEGKLLLTMRDLTDRRRWEVAGNETARFRSLVHHASTVTMLLSADGTLQSVSGAITRQLGLDPESVCGKHLATIVDPADHAALAVALGAAPASAAADPTIVEVQLCNAFGGRVPFELTFVSLLDDPTVGGLVVTGHDISRLRAAQEALEQLATYDTLTGVFNRRVFDAVIEREWTLTQSDGVDSYLLVADLDGFKQLNDDHGHAAGDIALREFALILRNLARETDLVARIGGDEFCVLQVRCGGELAALGLEARIQEEMARRTWPGDVPLGVTIGHQSLKRSSSAADALEQADLSMLSTKRAR
ncbi:MAG: sensor domain-containing diguanylate cyclase [Microthrixaceae bacterium]